MCKRLLWRHLNDYMYGGGSSPTMSAHNDSYGTHLFCSSSASVVIPAGVCFVKKKLDHQCPESCLGRPRGTETSSLNYTHGPLPPPHLARHSISSQSYYRRILQSICSHTKIRYNSQYLIKYRRTFNIT